MSFYVEGHANVTRNTSKVGVGEKKYNPPLQKPNKQKMSLTNLSAVQDRHGSFLCLMMNKINLMHET